MSNLNIWIGYRLIKSPSQYNTSYLNDDYKTPTPKSVSFYGLVEGKKTPGEIKITIPVNDGGAGLANFYWALEVATAFDNIVTNNPQYTLADATLISNYQNHVLDNADYQIYWTQAVADYKKDTNHTDDANFLSGVFLKIWNRFFNYLASTGCPIAAGDILLHYLRSGKKKPFDMSPQSFYTRFQKVLHAVKLLDRCYEKELDNKEAKIIFSMPFLRSKSRITCAMDSATLIKKLLKTSRISFKVILTLLHPRKMTNLSIAETTEASLLLVATSLSPIETTQTPPGPQLLRTLAAPLTSLGIALTPLRDLTPACQIFAINVVFVKIAVLNGMIAPCIILPLALKLQRILMSCANPPKFPNPIHHCAVLPHHHVVSATATPRTTLTNLIIPNVVDHVATRVAVLAAAPLVDHPAVIVRIMIEPLIDPLGLVMITTLVTMTFLMIHQPSNMTAT